MMNWTLTDQVWITRNGDEPFVVIWFDAEPRLREDGKYWSSKASNQITVVENLLLKKKFGISLKPGEKKLFRLMFEHQLDSDEPPIKLPKYAVERIKRASQ